MRFRTGNFAMGFCIRLTACSLVGMLAMCSMSSCERYPESYASPPQRPNFEDPERWERIIHMTDVDAPDHFFADISETLAANWRWTGKQPMVLLDVPARGASAPALNYHIEFALPEASFHDSGTRMLTFLVNGHVLGREQYAAAGSYRFEKVVPMEWISRAGEVRLGAEIDRMFVAKEDGNAYGFILVGIGLKRN